MKREVRGESSELALSRDGARIEELGLGLEWALPQRRQPWEPGQGSDCLLLETASRVNLNPSDPKNLALQILCMNQEWLIY